MKNTTFFLLPLLILSLFSCQSEQDQLLSKIEAFEKQIDEEPTTENAEQMVDLYEQYIKQYPDDAENNARFLYRSAALMYRMNRFSAAISNLFKNINNFYESATTPMSAMFLGDIQLENLKNKEVAYSTYQSLIKAFPESEQAKKAIEKLPEGTPDFDTRLENMAEKIYNDSLNRIEYRIANTFIGSSEIYAALLPESASSADKLYKAAEVARSIRSFDKALELYKVIYDKYPDHEKAPQSLFMQAFTLDSDLKRVEEARDIYKAFISTYPEDDFADDAQVLLDNLGKDDEEIIEAITKGKQNTDEE